MVLLHQRRYSVVWLSLWCGLLWGGSGLAWGLQFAAEDRYEWASADALVEGLQWVTWQHEYPNATGMTCPNYLFFDPERPRSVKLLAVRIDTRTPGLRWFTTGRPENWGRPMPEFRGQNLSEFTVRTKRQTTRQFVEEQRQRGIPVVLAINAAPWSPFQNGVSHPYADRLGFAVNQGEVVCPPDGRRPSFLILPDGTPELRTVGVEENPIAWQAAVSGFSFCLREGQAVDEDTVLHPRTGIGVCADNRFVVWLVVDGRQAASQGATVHEVGQWLRFFGSQSGLNMDGGGSSTLVKWGVAENRGIVLNRPAHGERANGNNMGVAITPGK